MKINCDWKIKILTPVHIGGAQEKHWQEGLDFVIKEQKVYFLNQEKMINHWDVDPYSNALASGKLKELTKKINIADFSDRVEMISGKTREIRQHIKNAATGNPIIPGSSLKGALRSIIFNFLLDQSPNALSGNRIEQTIFGKISKDFMRFIQVGDVEFKKTEILNTKTLSLSGTNSFVWKNKRNGGENSLDSKRFASGYECISPGQYATGKIKFDLEGYRRAKKFVHNPEGLEKLFSEQFEENLFNIINEHSRTYFEKELAYFNQYAQAGCDAEHIEQVKADIGSLKDDLFIERRAPFRIAAGSGFHSITGDWQLKDHLVDDISFKGNRGMRNRKNSAKTRKLTFQYSKEIKSYTFSPMGYIQFLTEDDFEKNIKPELEAKKQKILEEKRKAAEEKKKREEEAKRKAEEAKKPKLTPKEKLKKNAEYVDIEVLKWKFGKLTVKPYVEGFETTKYTFTLPNSKEVGTIMRLKMKLIAKGKKLRHEGRPIQK